jgi:hypothetical protein
MSFRGGDAIDFHFEILLDCVVHELFDCLHEIGQTPYPPSWTFPLSSLLNLF